MLSVSKIVMVVVILAFSKGIAAFVYSNNCNQISKSTNKNQKAIKVLKVPKRTNKDQKGPRGPYVPKLQKKVNENNDFVKLTTSCYKNTIFCDS